VGDVRVLPSLREGTVVPKVTFVREAIADKTKLALLDILLDGIEKLFLGNFHLAIGPSWDLHDHVEDSAVLVGE